jgi:hypothetical protein
VRPCRDLLRALAGPPLGVLALGLAGCTTSAAKPTGVVTGVATPARVLSYRRGRFSM